jgi:intein/homing endonuclease
MFSQKSEIGNWFIYFGNQKINQNWNWHNEVQYRNYDFIGDTNQLLLRTGIGYNLTENNNNVLFGYAFVNTQKYILNSDQKVESNEHRIFQQFITKQNFGRFYFLHRYRLEERFLPDDFQMRVRYFLNVNIPLNKKILDKNAIYLAAYNEIFVNTEKPLLDRNRIYTALGYVINKNIKVEAGVMAQILEQSNRNQFQIVIFNNLPFNN